MTLNKTFIVNLHKLTQRIAFLKTYLEPRKNFSDINYITLASYDSISQWDEPCWCRPASTMGTPAVAMHHGLHVMSKRVLFKRMGSSLARAYLYTLYIYVVHALRLSYLQLMRKEDGGFWMNYSISFNCEWIYGAHVQRSRSLWWKSKWSLKCLRVVMSMLPFCMWTEWGISCCHFEQANAI